MDFCRMALQDLGYTVTSTTSSHKALEVFRSRPEEFDVVITDLIMPDMTGLELAREVLHLRPDIPFILITGYSEATSPDEAEKSGIRKFLMKPIIAYRIWPELSEKSWKNILNVHRNTLNGEPMRKDHDGLRA